MRTLLSRQVHGFLIAALVATFVCLGAMPAMAVPLSSSSGASCAKKNVLFVMDRSGSMKEDNKFDDARKIIHDTAQRYDSKVRFGLETFSTAPNIDEPLPTPAANIQKTLRVVVNNGSTQMVKAMELAAKHLRSVLSTDSVANRPTYVLLVTDGKPNPPPCPVAQVKALRSLDVGGVKHDIKTYVVGFGAKVDVKCLNSLAEAGGTALPRANYKYILAANAKELNDAMNEIVGRTASQEVCNGKDDDCDGYIDNRKGSRQDYTLVQSCSTKCGTGIQLCVRGKWQACSVSAPRNEVCNDKDDDCNGRIDDGAPCPRGESCYEGRCRRQCRGNECPQGQICTHHVCVDKPGKGNGGTGSNGGANGNNNNNSNGNKGGGNKGGGNKGGNGGGKGNGNGAGCSINATPTDGTLFFFWMLLLAFPLGIRLLHRSRSRS